MRSMKTPMRAMASSEDTGPRLYRPEGDESRTARWRINGLPARLVIWTIEEWEGLDPPPSDAQFMACGLWCALRME
jgi:hypothetical protein